MQQRKQASVHCCCSLVQSALALTWPCCCVCAHVKPVLAQQQEQQRHCGSMAFLAFLMQPYI